MTQRHTPSIEHGVRIINERLQTITSDPGVYRMLDADGGILYVGKAKNLAKRVASYKRIPSLSYRIQNMVALICDIKTYSTQTEAEALLLEANLIKEHKPRFNVLLKDDKSYPYILITKGHDFPRIMKHRGSHKAQGNYYGPYASAGAVNHAITDLQKVFMIRPCSDSYFENRPRPCMEFQIKRCSAPCVGKVTPSDYAESVKLLEVFLKGKTRDVQESLALRMQEASDAMEYEKAAAYRDRIKALNHIQSKQTVHMANLKDCDVLGLARGTDIACVELCLYRGSQHFGNRSYFFEDADGLSDVQLIEQFVLQFYHRHHPPAHILLPVSIPNITSLKEALYNLTDVNIGITCPAKGDKRILIDNANHNAESSLRHHQAKQLKNNQLLRMVAHIFEMDTPPARIEVYDNSHISGTNRVGAMIVATPEGFDKSSYRTYNITYNDEATGDDYAMLREVLTRRLTRLKEDPEQKPDLMLIDGGAGQLSSALQIIDQFDMRQAITVVGIAKGKDRNAGRERFFIPGKEAFTLPKGDPALHYLQVLRDEAHRWAITSHRNKRTRAIKHSSLDDIPGIGPKRKQLLLTHFGSLDAIKEASLEQLCKVKGIDASTAQTIKDHLS